VTHRSCARRRLALLLGGAALAWQPQVASARELPGRFDLGANADGDVCVATRSWSEGGSVRVAAQQPFAITCRGSTQTRGYAARTDSMADTCGAESTADVAGLGRVTLARCRDARIGQPVVAIEAGGWRGAAIESAVAPMVRLLRSLKAGRVTPPAPVTVALAEVAPAPAEGPDAGGLHQTGIDAAAAVQLGLGYIYAGSNVEASRLLNDAIAQFAGAPLSDRAELRLNAALSDSNIGEFGAADAHFAEADRLVGGDTPDPALQEQAAAYRALHLVNQGQWRAALAVLPGAGRGAGSLADPATLAVLNRPPAAAVAGTIDTTRGANAMILATQEEIVRSTAHLRLGELDAASAALNRAVTQEARISAALTPPGAPPRSLPWLRARLERQRGRIALVRGQNAAALGAFDCAIATMQDVAAPARAQCTFPTRTAGIGAALSGPVIAEAQLERAAALERQPGVTRAAVLAQYQTAVDTLAASSDNAAATSPLLARYLDLLVAQADGGDQAAGERFFRALQTVREPGIAREYAALQSVVSSGRAGALVRDRRDLERQRNQLRAEIGTLAPDAARLRDAQVERDAVDARLEAVKQRLRDNGGTAAIDDEPVTLAALQRGLRPGEAYLKLVPVGAKVYGAVVTPTARSIYVAGASAAQVSDAATALLATARSRTGADGRARIRPFAADRAYELFSLVAGPAAPLLTAARALVVDTGSTLGALPVAVLVTRPVAAPDRGQTDYSAVPFLAKTAELASALSPRTFLRARLTLAPSAAPRSLIGFGQNAPAPAEPASGETAPLMVGAVCRIGYADWAANLNANRPVPADEIGAAATALGARDAQVVTGAAFTDSDIMQRSDRGELSQYQVLHFATHGIPATPLPGRCETPLPPSLITSLAPPRSVPAVFPSDGLLSFVDVARLRLDANLVMLSACDTASGVDTVTGRLAGQEGSAATLDGLVRAFIVAQARAVVATYWRVPATAGTQDLVAAFYRAGRDGTIGAALHRAQLTVLSDPATSHPYFWAAFFLVGDGAKSMLTTPAAPSSVGVASARKSW